MDSEIYDVLVSIDTTLNSLASVVNGISDHWFPIVIGGIAVVVVSILVSWLVKI